MFSTDWHFFLLKRKQKLLDAEIVAIKMGPLEVGSSKTNLCSELPWLIRYQMPFRLLLLLVLLQLLYLNIGLINQEERTNQPSMDCNLTASTLRTLFLFGYQSGYSSSLLKQRNFSLIVRSSQSKVNELFIMVSVWKGDSARKKDLTPQQLFSPYTNCM